MTRTESARLVGHNYRHLGVTFGKPWERIDRCGPGEYVGKHQAAPDCRCVEAGQPIFEGVGVYHLHDFDDTDWGSAR